MSTLDYVADGRHAGRSVRIAARRAGYLGFAVWLDDEPLNVGWINTHAVRGWTVRARSADRAGATVHVGYSTTMRGAASLLLDRAPRNLSPTS